MKKLKCKVCEKEWYVENNVLDKINVCPFCAVSFREKMEIKVFDSLDKAIYGAISKKGIDILQNMRQLSGYLLDIAPSLKKEIHIFSKAISEDYARYIKTTFEQDEESAKITINKLRHLLITEEGLSGEWADLICNQLLGAISYMKNEKTRIVKLDVMEFTMPTGEQETKDNKTPYKGQCKCRVCGYSINKREIPSGGMSCPVCHADNKWKMEEDIVEENISGLESTISSSGKESKKRVDSLGEYTCRICGHVLNAKEMPVGGTSCPVCCANKWSWNIHYKKEIVKNMMKLKSNLCLETWHVEDDGLSETWADINFLSGYQEQNNEEQAEIENIDFELYKEKNNLLKGDVKTLMDLAFSYIKGTTKDERRAADCFESAARMGDGEAQYYLGMCYKRGQGREVNNALAASWFHKAVLQLNTSDYFKKEAMRMLKSCIEKMPAIEQLWWESRLKELEKTSCEE